MPHLGPGPVAGAIGLDHQLALAAGKIREVGSNRQLAHELEAIEPAVAQFLPQAALGLGVILAQRPGAGAGCSGLVGHEFETDG